MNRFFSTFHLKPSLRRSALAGGVVLVSLLSACAVPVTRVTRIYDEPGSMSVARAVDYGTVQRIEVTDTRQDVGGGGALLGGLIGGVVGNQVGHGVGRAAVTALGAVGGAVVGNEVEGRQAAAHSGTRYEVFVRLDNGSSQRFNFDAPNGFRVGQRVRIDGAGMLSIV